MVQLNALRYAQCAKLLHSFVTMASQAESQNASEPSEASDQLPSLRPDALIADKYRLLKPLGTGGMAAVWLAKNELLDIEVAIKFIRADLESPELVTRLIQEARAAARLAHPAIVRVLDFGKLTTRDPYVVMELLRGQELSDVLTERGRLPAVEAVQILLPIAHGLASAHRKGIIHRDIKPENVFLVERPEEPIQPKLMDFGIAKLEENNAKRITQLGSTMGSPAYMSPEQARGKDVDPRSDVWSFCVMLYELCTGVLPFEGDSATALLCEILEKDPTPMVNLSAGDANLWAVVEKGLNKDRQKRWSSMMTLGRALAHWLLDNGVIEDASGNALELKWRDGHSVFPTGSGPQTIAPAGRASLADISTSPRRLTPQGGANLDQSSSHPNLAATQLTAHSTPPPERSGRSRLWLAVVAALTILALAAFAYPYFKSKNVGDPAIAAPPTPTETSAPESNPKEDLSQPEKTAAQETSAQPPPSTAPPPSATTKLKRDPRPTARPTSQSTPQPRKPTPKPTTTAAPTTSPSTKKTGSGLDIKTDF